MGTGREFAGHRPNGIDARMDERSVRVLFVEERSEIADEIRSSVGRAGCGSFDVVRETSLVNAAAQIGGEAFDLLLLDPALPGVERSAAIELASDLAHRLPVVVLTGIENLEASTQDMRGGLRCRIEQADIAGKLLSAIRRARRLGTGVMTPVFCRIDELCC
ncbi:MAG: hypothetical protein CL908_01535 [Deltaproteobacteria bacterium]|nr:hypothetical protein [Deltaproteobacteria bacterium]